MKTELTKSIETALLEDERTAEASIEVIDRNGVITLRGYVASRQAYEAAEEITREVDQVVGVANELDIESQEESAQPLGPAHLARPTNA